MKIYIIAGEASGDLHASNLMKQLNKHEQGIQFRAWGGDLMRNEGAELVKHYRDLAFMGFAEVILNLRTILNNLKFCKEDILQFKPDALILVDYPGFNLRIAEWAHDHGIKVLYYISPQIWAWKENRIHKIKKSVDKMFVVLPFEKDFYKKHNYDVTFTGHPLLDVIDERKREPSSFIRQNNLDSKPIIALLPGSRKQEISTMLPIMLSVSKQFPEYQFVVGGAPGQDASFYKQFIEGKNVSIVFGKTYDLLQNADAGMVTSGTATLEAGLFRLPQVVCYKGNKISYLIAKQLVKIKYISLVNLILDKEAVRELIQDELNARNLVDELKALLNNKDRISTMTADYDNLHLKLGGKGASERTATAMLKIIKNQ